MFLGDGVKFGEAQRNYRCGAKYKTAQAQQQLQQFVAEQPTLHSLVLPDNGDFLGATYKDFILSLVGLMINR